MSCVRGGDDVDGVANNSSTIRHLWAIVSCHVESASERRCFGEMERRALESSRSHCSDLDHCQRWICVMLCENEVVDARGEMGEKRQSKCGRSDSFQEKSKWLLVASICCH